MANTRRGWGAVRKLPSGRFQARYPDPDTGKLVPGPVTFADRKSADRWLSRKRTEIDDGTATNEKAAMRPLSSWWPGYENSIQHLKLGTKVGYVREWRLRVAPTFGAMPVRRINGNRIDDWVADMIAAGVSVSRVVEALGVLKRVLDRAVRDHAIARNPATDRSIKLKMPPRLERPVLTPAEVEKLTCGMRLPRDRALVRLLAYGGLRIGEALALRWSDINFKGRTVTIRLSVEDTTGKLVVGPTKSYAVRTVDLPDAVIEEIQGLRKTALLIFPSRLGRHLRYRNWRRDQWDKAVVRSGVEALPHDLRGTCASLLIDAGASVKDVQKHLGHEDELTTLRLYVRVRPGRSADLVERLNKLIAEAA
ncbi:tyrosine-type recombinase/integrase [Paractinoplanes rishiriensis]|uniref:Site-specific integrase n=1 Tax=Paractinoplanes rishiriensis TaxID=1050105 RepID=A0A919MWF7_9ACTN|nr:site-specific integrase [Actinoplanes rishiriensis]GIF02442.1 site-specific integrase [Actinoplanes rishiriensis]